MNTIWTAISFIIIFSVIVVSHEFGHYLIGRLNGIGVEEFTIGMGPAIYKKKGKHTTFAIRLFPIGGACIFKGMGLGAEADEDDANDADDLEDEDGKELTETLDSLEELDDHYKAIAFNDAPVGARIATVAAGPIFNILFAFLFSIFLCWNCGSDIPVLVDVMEGYPAEAAGLQAGDVITRIDNQKIYVWREISVCSMLNYGEPFEIEYERDGVRHVANIVPQYNEETGRYYIGFIGGSVPVECRNLSVFKYSAIEVRYWFITTYRSLLFMFSGHASINDFSGPVGIATVIDDTIEETSQYGVFTVILNLVNLTILLSVNLGVFNIIPFPALDGGRLLLLFVEAITRKKIPPEKEGAFHFVGFVLLMALMLLVFFNDIIRAMR